MMTKTMFKKTFTLGKCNPFVKVLPKRIHLNYQSLCVSGHRLMVRTKLFRVLSDGIVQLIVRKQYHVL